MQTYSSKATARRGAHRQRLTPGKFTVEQDTSTGLWHLKTDEPASTEPSPNAAMSTEQTPPKPSSRRLQGARTTKQTKAPKRKMPQGRADKAVKQQAISTAANPVAFIWHWLSQGNNAKLKRADAIAALVDLGVARGTASTQGFRFLSASPAERKARAARYEDR